MLPEGAKIVERTVSPSRSGRACGGRVLGSQPQGLERVRECMRSYYDRLVARLPEWAPRSGDYFAYAIGGLIVLVALLWSYWPTVTDLIREWNLSDEYSCGILVPFLTALRPLATSPGFAVHSRSTGPAPRHGRLSSRPGRQGPGPRLLFLCGEILDRSVPGGPRAADIGVEIRGQACHGSAVLVPDAPVAAPRSGDRHSAPPEVVHHLGGFLPGTGRL